jgi:Leucine-rich repeat (LRR) protein
MRTLKELKCGANNISSMAPLQGLNIRKLVFSDNHVSSLDALQGLPIYALCCEQNRVSDISPLAGMKAAILQVGNNAISDLAPLQHGRYEILSIEKNMIATLDDLKQAPLKYLYCSDNRISDLSPITSCPISVLYCAGNCLSSLRPLAGKNIEQLNCSRNPLETLAPLIDNPPEEFIFDCDSLADSELEKAARVWSKNDRTARHAAHARILLATRRGEAKLLQESGVKLSGHSYLFVPKDVTWHEAKQLCERLGGHLATISSLEQLNLLCSMVPFCKGQQIFGAGAQGYRFNPWIGLETKNNAVCWTTGEPVLFQLVLPLGTQDLLRHENRKGVLDFSARLAAASLSDDHLPFFIQWDD